MLARDVFGRFLRDHTRALVGWVAAVAGVTALYSGFWPSMEDSSDLMDAYMRNLPSGMSEAMGWTELSTPEGYLNTTVFGLLVPILMVVAGITLGARAIAGDEEEGELELVLAHPVGRARVVLQRFAGLVVFLLVLGLALFATLVALDPVLDLGVPTGRILAAATATTLIAVCYGTLAMSVGAVTGRRAYALGAAALLAVVGYLGNTFALQVEDLEWLRFASAFYYALDPEPLSNGVDPGYTGVLVAIPVVVIALGLAAFSRRDVLV